MQQLATNDEIKTHREICFTLIIFAETFVHVQLTRKYFIPFSFTCSNGAQIKNAGLGSIAGRSSVVHPQFDADAKSLRVKVFRGVYFTSVERSSLSHSHNVEFRGHLLARNVNTQFERLYARAPVALSSRLIITPVSKFSS